MFNTIFLGKGREYSTDPAVTGINNNIVVVGGSGSGKTMSVMEMKLLRNEGRSMIVNVSKRKLIWKYTRYFQEKGFDVKCLDMSKPMNGDVSFDPLHYIHGLDDSILASRTWQRALSVHVRTRGLLTKLSGTCAPCTFSWQKSTMS